MKNKLNKPLQTGLISAACSLMLLGSASLSDAQVLITNVIDTYDVVPPNGDGQRIGREWGPGSAAWDGANGNPAGSMVVTCVFGSGSDTPSTAFSCNGDWSNPWSVQFPISFSLYDNLEFDIKYDNTSDITIDQFNNLSTWDTTTTNRAGQLIMQSWTGSGYLSGSTPGIEIALCGGPGGQMAPVIAVTNIPAAAASGWAHMKIPINKAQANIDGVSGIVFHKWINQNWGIEATVSVTNRFSIDNLMLTGSAAPTPPPTVSAPTTKAIQGLNIFSSTTGNSFYDRQEAVLRQSTGLSWVGQATPGTPVAYSFTIASYPNSANCEAYMYLAPNEPSVLASPDWNETNCVKINIQGTPTDATMRFRYKVNESGQQAMYSGGNETRGYYTNAPGSWDGVTSNYLESGDLGFVTNNGVLGTWTIQFTSDTNITLIAPNGNSSSFVMPPYNVGNFAEVSAFNVYLGMQANQADGMNKAVVYSNFAVTGVVTPYSENFLASSVLDTNIWNNSVAGGPKGVLIVPVNSAYWISWTLPDAGFSLQTAPTLDNALAWTSPVAGPLIPMSGVRSQLVDTNELPVGGSAFFRLIKREFSQLQVLLPGETNAPNTLTGKVGTPDPVSLGAGGFMTVTINAVDATWHLVSSGSGTINLTSSDTSAVMPLNAALVNGTLQQTVQFGATGSWTITATNTASATMPAATSSSVTVNP